MAAIAIRQSVVDGLTPQRRLLLNFVLQRLHLGDPALYTNGTNTFYVWDDPRIDPIDIAVLGTLAANWALIPQGYDPTTDDEATVKQKIRQFLQSKIVLPRDVNVPDDADVFTAVLAAQNPPAAIHAARGLPSDWVPA